MDRTASGNLNLSYAARIFSTGSVVAVVSGALVAMVQAGLGSPPGVDEFAPIAIAISPAIVFSVPFALLAAFERRSNACHLASGVPMAGLVALFTVWLARDLAGQAGESSTVPTFLAPYFYTASVAAYASLWLTKSISRGPRIVSPSPGEPPAP